MINNELASSIVLLVLFTIVMGMFLFPVQVNKSICFFNKQQTECVKAIAALMVVTAHTIGKSRIGGVSPLLSQMGFLAVGLFFLISGYGIAINYLQKDNYLKGFLIKRFLGVVIPFWITNAIYIVFDGKTFTTWEAVKYLLGIKLINGDLWFVRRIIILYLIFYLAGIIIKNKKKALIAVVILIVVENIVFIIIENYWGQTIPFLLGVLLAIVLNEQNNICNNLKKRINKHYIIIVLFLAILFIGTYLYVGFIRWKFPQNNIVFIIVGEICQIVFALLIVMLSKQFTVGNRLTVFVGTYSFGIYLIQRLFINKLLFLNEKNSLMYIVVVIIASCVVGIAYYCIIKRITKIKKRK